MGYDISQIQLVLDAAQIINRQYQVMLASLPEHISIQESIKCPILIGTHHIADVVVYNHKDRTPWIEFIK